MNPVTTRWHSQPHSPACAGDPVVPHPGGAAQWVSLLRRPICHHPGCTILSHRIVSDAWWIDCDRRQVRDLDDSCVLAVEE